MRSAFIATLALVGFGFAISPATAISFQVGPVECNIAVPGASVELGHGGATVRGMVDGKQRSFVARWGVQEVAKVSGKPRTNLAFKVGKLAACRAVATLSSVGKCSMGVQGGTCSYCVAGGKCQTFRLSVTSEN